MLAAFARSCQSIAFASPGRGCDPSLEPGGFAEAIREHEAILDAIQTGDGVLAETLVREHARFALRGVKSAIDPPAPVQNKGSGKQSLRRKIRGANPACRNDRPYISAGTRRGRGPVLRKRIQCDHHAGDRRPSEHSSGIALLPHLRKRGTAVPHQQSCLEALERQVVKNSKPGNARDRLAALIRGHLQGMFENPNRALASISEFRSLSPAHRREIIALRRSYSGLLNRDSRPP